MLLKWSQICLSFQFCLLTIEAKNDQIVAVLTIFAVELFIRNNANSDQSVKEVILNNDIQRRACRLRCQFIAMVPSFCL